MSVHMKFSSSRLQQRKEQPNVFQGVLSYKENGKYREIRKRLKAKTLKAAKLELEEWRQEEEGQAANKKSVRGKCPCFVEYAEEIIAYRKALKEVSGARLHDYGVLLGTIKKYLPNKRINEYTQSDIQRFYKRLTAQGKSSQTLHKTHYFLKMVFDKALQEELIEKSPMMFIKTPKKENIKSGINSLTMDGAKDFISLISALPPSAVRMATILAFYTGMRRGECCGLRWSDVDFDKKVIKVQRAVGRAYENNAYELKDTKTHNAREVAIPDALLTELEDWQELQGDERFVLGKGGEWPNPDYIGKKYTATIETLGIKGIEGRLLTFHDLRHTYATITIAQGADVVSVASQLGHADVSMTLNTYASVLPQAKKQVASIMDKLAQ